MNWLFFSACLCPRLSSFSVLSQVNNYSMVWKMVILSKLWRGKGTNLPTHANYSPTFFILAFILFFREKKKKKRLLRVMCCTPIIAILSVHNCSVKEDEIVFSTHDLIILTKLYFYFHFYCWMISFSLCFINYWLMLWLSWFYSW